MFGATSTFGTTGTTFGSGSFTGGGTTTNVFQPASQPATSLFGAPATGFNSGFNANKPNAFGTSTFGSPQNTSLFGQQTRPATMFGATSPGTPGGFGAPAVAQAQGTSIPFNAITGSDTMMKNGVQSPISTRHQCITCMKEYEHKSLEELRYEDYQLGRKVPPQGAMFSGSVASPNTGLFSTPTSTATSAFGQRPNTFGAPATSGGLFSNLNQNKTSFFAPTTTNAFGNSSFGQLGTQPTPQTSLFGQTSTTTTGGIGTTPAFSFNQQPQQQNLGLFGAKPATNTPATSTAFGGFGTNPTANKPLGGIFSTPTTGFGTSAAPTFGNTTTTPSLFSANTQQPKLGFSTGFGQSAPTFGTQPTSSSAFTFPTASTSSNLFSGTAPFGGTAPTTSSFGFGSSFGTTPSFSLGNPPGGNTGFSTGTLGFNQPATSSFNFNVPAQNTFGQQQNQPPQSPPTGPVPFATSPYKDSPLFYNLVTNRNLDDMSKPTNPLAQNRSVKEATRRTSTGHASLGTHAAIKNMTYPVSKIQNFNKQNSIFDGFDDDCFDQGPSIDILSPKSSSVKKLSLKNVRGSTRMSLPNNSNSFSLSLNSNGFRRDSNFDTSGMTSASNNMDDPNTSQVREPELIGDGPHGNTNVSFQDRETPPPSKSSSVDELDSRRRNSVGQMDGMRGDGNISDGYNKSRVVSTRPDYYIIPGIEELNYSTTDDGKCIIRNFRVGRFNYGEVRFLEPVNVAGINIDDTVMFRHKEIVVYPDSDSSPRVGEGLNVPAEVSLERVWPLEKGTKDPIKSPDKIRAMKYENLLRRSCERMDAQFVSYDDQKGTWTFRVKHFSKYSCVPEEKDEEEAEDQVMTNLDKRPVKGLGGIPLSELKAGDMGSHGFDKENENFTFLKPAKPMEKQSAASVVPVNEIFKGFSSSPPYEGPKEVPSFDNFVSPRAKDIVSMLSGRDYGGMGDYSMSEGGYYNTSAPDKSKESLALIPSRDSRSMTKFGMRAEELEYSKKVPEQVVPSISIPSRVPAKPTNDRQLFRYCTREQVLRNGLTKQLSLFDGFRGTIAKDLVPRRCARACFGKDGHLVVVQNGILTSELKFNGVVKIQKLDHLANSVKRNTSVDESKNLIAALNLYLESSELKRDTLVLTNTEIIVQHLRVLQDLQQQQSTVSSLSGELLVWQLMDLLYTPFTEMSFAARTDQEFLISQRYAVNQWMINNARLLFGKLYQSDNSSMRGLLMKGKKHEACKLAVKQKNYYLSLCLAQNCEASQKLCDTQLEAWEQEGAIEFINPEIREIYTLCAGRPIWQNLNIEEMSTEEWLQL